MPSQKIDRNKQPGGEAAKRYQAVQEMTSSGEYTVSETARAAGISRQAYYKWLNQIVATRTAGTGSTGGDQANRKTASR